MLLSREQIKHQRYLAKKWAMANPDRVKRYHQEYYENNRDNYSKREVFKLIKRDKILPLTKDIICVKLSYISCAMRIEKCDLCRCLTGCKFYKPIDLVKTDGLHLGVRHR